MLIGSDRTRPPGRNPVPAPGEPDKAGQGGSRRVIGVDVARGLALVGIIIVNVFPPSAGGTATAEWAVLAGRPAALFALIAGISIALLTGGRRTPAGRAMTANRAGLALRALLITSIGLLLGPTDTTVAIILPYYGILFLLAVPLLGLGRRTLLGLSVVFAVLGPVAMQLVRASWPDMPQVQDEYSFSLAAAQPGVFLTDMLLTGFYPALPWVAYICVGVAVGRMDLTSRKVAAVLLAAGSALAAFMWLLSMVLLGPGGGLNRIVAATPLLSREEINSILIFGGNVDTSAETLPATTGWWLAILSPYTSTPVTILHTLGIALAALGAVLLLVPLLGGTAGPLAAMGSMTLTLYSAHVIVLATEILDESRPVMSITIQCIVFLLAAVLWRNAIGKGPLESVVAVSTAWLRTLVLNRGRPTRQPAG
ncbi:Protein of unknown function (DUF1624) [Arthrobacter sp. VKM Ac-2550]|nr:Protein of unknown function (DUF1624) [Arthrobacter sp. VKM Ac-2550]